MHTNAYSCSSTYAYAYPSRSKGDLLDLNLEKYDLCTVLSSGCLPPSLPPSPSPSLSLLSQAPLRLRFLYFPSVLKPSTGKMSHLEGHPSCRRRRVGAASTRALRSCWFLTSPSDLLAGRAVLGGGCSGGLRSGMRRVSPEK